MKINLNKICLKKYFGQSLLVFVMLLVGVFTLSTSVKAQVTVYDVPFTNGTSAYISIPENSGNNILVCYGYNGSYQGYFDFAVDGVGMTKLVNFLGHDNGGSVISYTTNLTAGAKLLTNNGNNGECPWNCNPVAIRKCIFIDNVSPENPIKNYQLDINNLQQYPNGTNDNVLLFIPQRNFSLEGSNIPSSVNSSFINYGAAPSGGSYQTYAMSAFYKIISSSLETFTTSNIGYGGAGYFIELDTAVILPPCESYNYSDWGFCGENGRQFRTILSSNPMSCSYTDVNSAAPVLGQDCTYVAPVYPDTSLPFTIVSPFTFSYESTAKVDYTYDTDVFTPYDYIEVRRLSSDWATSTFISTSSPVANDLLHNGNSFFILPGDQEIRGRHNYEVVGYFAPYYLPGVGDMPATSSIPVVFSVYWQKTQIPTAQDIIDYEHTVSTELAHGVLYESSCTNEEWATPDPQVDFGFGVWTFPALNFTKLHCAVKLATLELGTEVIDKVTGYFTKIGNMLKNVFPFNIYTNLSEAWENSAYTDVLPELSFLSPVNGNLSVQVPNGVTGSSTSFVLWGSSIFTSADTLGENNANKASLLFGAIRTIIKWALWGLFGFWVVRNGQAFVKKLTGGE